ncbi:hypothetical protein Y032_0455g1751 [Ancylostoma ceylanicum]|uniref:Uncharacterized protein n=1 Tax=Ancylostoma ceylanicum TaxID=53326 RepID=A0A016WYG2_9BILA|nr:hypothetical protein Y032_0455g1751 [Ancylostoma ceylanicum]
MDLIAVGGRDGVRNPQHATHYTNPDCEWCDQRDRFSLLNGGLQSFYDDGIDLDAPIGGDGQHLQFYGNLH